MPGTLFIIAAPSGTGKTTLVRSLCNNIPNLKVSISCTTRPKRAGEEEGVDYYFIDKKTFDEMAANNQFLEHECVFDHYYGTPKQWIEDQIAGGNDIILEIDWQGARDVRKLMPEKVVSIFILPPVFSTLEKRLVDRQQDDEKTIKRRMQDALNELSHYSEFDYLVVNDNLDHALSEIRKIVEHRRQGKPYRGPDLEEFAKRLMAEGSKIQ